MKGEEKNYIFLFACCILKPPAPSLPSALLLPCFYQRSLPPTDLYSDSALMCTLALLKSCRPWPQSSHCLWCSGLCHHSIPTGAVYTLANHTATFKGWPEECQEAMLAQESLCTGVLQSLPFVLTGLKCPLWNFQFWQHQAMDYYRDVHLLHERKAACFTTYSVTPWFTKIELISALKKEPGWELGHTMRKFWWDLRKKTFYCKKGRRLWGP